MGDLYKRHRILLKTAAILCVIVLVYGTLLIIDAIQQSARDVGFTESFSIKENTGEIPAYNVDGMTDEQIQEMLEFERNRRSE